MVLSLLTLGKKIGKSKISLKHALRDLSRGIVHSEAATRVVLPKRVYLKIQQIPQVNSCVGVSFDRSSLWRCSVEKRVLKFFANFTGNNCVGLFLIKFVKNFVEKRLQHNCFPVKFGKFLRTPILKNVCERLLPFRLQWPTSILILKLQ